jgi:cellulose synthase/poly-beta-1,6-N-acetylglucosamine synthase-like glycosyltransferase
MSVFWHVVFWLSLLILAYTYVGYPALLLALSRLRRRPAAPKELDGPPAAQVVLVVRNEAERVIGRIRNLLATDYPTDLLSVLVVSDGSDDDTVQRVRDLADDRVQALDLPESRGKSAGLDAALRVAEAEILVFTDARQRFRTDTIPKLIAHFADPEVGAVSGALEVGDGGGDSVGRGVDAYWRLEKFIRAREADWDSSIGCTGAVYAARRDCLTPMPENTILDDVVFPMTVALTGKRVLFDPAAIAEDPQGFSADKETARKERTLAGNFQMLLRYPGWLLPWRNRLWWQLISHKYLRIAAPLFFVTMLVSNTVLAGEPLYLLLLLGHLAFYLSAGIGLLANSCRVPAVIRYPTALVFLNLRVVRGLYRYLRGDFNCGWVNKKP